MGSQSAEVEQRQQQQQQQQRKRAGVAAGAAVPPHLETLVDRLRLIYARVDLIIRSSASKIFVLGVSSVFIGCENIVMAELGSTTGAEEEETNRYGRFRPPHSSPVYAL